ncbi:MAG: iron-sulfur cluster repair di-iron protein [Bacteroidia bacterium]
MKVIYKEPSIGAMVAEDYRKADVLKKHDIDFCCGGKKTLTEACIEKHLNRDVIQRELDELESTSANNEHNFTDWDPAFLADYIVNTHHKYVRNNIPIILEYLEKVVHVHGDKYPQSSTILQLFNGVVDELVGHMIKEEKILFPYIKQLAAFKDNELSNPDCPFGTVKNPIGIMEDEHTTVGNLFKTIRELTHDYVPPVGACTTHRISYLKLKEFEEDLHRHIHLENNILFPKAIALEAELNIG